MMGAFVPGGARAAPRAPPALRPLPAGRRPRALRAAVARPRPGGLVARAVPERLVFEDRKRQTSAALEAARRAVEASRRRDPALPSRFGDPFSRSHVSGPLPPGSNGLEPLPDGAATRPRRPLPFAEPPARELRFGAVASAEPAELRLGAQSQTEEEEGEVDGGAEKGGVAEAAAVAEASEVRSGISAPSASLSSSSSSSSSSAAVRRVLREDGGEEFGADGLWLRWTEREGASADGSSRWGERWWEASDWRGAKELGAEKWGFDADGNAWRETWREALEVNDETGRPDVVRTAHKWGTKGGAGGDRGGAPAPSSAPSLTASETAAGALDALRLSESDRGVSYAVPSRPSPSSEEWEERWSERYSSAGPVAKEADKWARKGSHVWHERWGEDFDGKGGVVKWTDRWAERDEAERAEEEAGRGAGEAEGGRAGGGAAEAEGGRAGGGAGFPSPSSGGGGSEPSSPGEGVFSSAEGAFSAAPLSAPPPHLDFAPHPEDERPAPAPSPSPSTSPSSPAIARWGDKWEERFKDGKGTRRGETWWAAPSGASYSRCWGEDHSGDGHVRRFGHATDGEHWDVSDDGGTHYEAAPHFGYAHAVAHSPQLLAVKELPRDAGMDLEAGFASGVDDEGDDDDDDDDDDGTSAGARSRSLRGSDAFFLGGGGFLHLGSTDDDPGFADPRPDAPAGETARRDGSGEAASTSDAALAPSPALPTHLTFGPRPSPDPGRGGAHGASGAPGASASPRRSSESSWARHTTLSDEWTAPEDAAPLPPGAPGSKERKPPSFLHFADGGEPPEPSADQFRK